MEDIFEIGKSRITVDPRSKMFMLIITFSTLSKQFYNKPIEIMMMTLIILLLINANLIKTAIRMGVLFLFMLFLEIFVMPHIEVKSLKNLVKIFSITLRLLLPIFGSMVLVIRTTTVSEFVSAFKKMKIPDIIIIPFSIMFRFIPTIKDEWKSIKNAMKFRNIGLDFKNVFTKPMITMEYILVPLLMSTTNISNNLAAASLSRGLDIGKERTCMTEVKLGIVDFIIFFASIIYIYFVYN